MPSIFSAVAVVVAALAGPSARSVPSASRDAGDFCRRVGAGVVAGQVGVAELVELSGLAASRTTPGDWWAHNDSGDTARLFVIRAAGAGVAQYAIEGADAVDWEDLAVGPGPDPAQSYVYIGDIGDNDAARDHVTVYRVPEPAQIPVGEVGTLAGAEAFTIRYPDGAHDAETLMVDPLDGTLAIVTKSLTGTSTVFEAPAAALVDGATVTMTATGTVTVTDVAQLDPAAPLNLPGTMVTSGDISPDGRTILLRTYQRVLAFQRTEGMSIGAALSGTPCAAPAAVEPQGEAIAFSADGSAYVTAGETQLAVAQGALPVGATSPLTRFEIAPALSSAPSTEPGTAGDASDSVPETAGGASDSLPDTAGDASDSIPETTHGAAGAVPDTSAAPPSATDSGPTSTGVHRHASRAGALAWVAAVSVLASATLAALLVRRRRGRRKSA